MEVLWVKNLDKIYRFEEKHIGKGQYGTVKKATHIASGEACACKIVQRVNDYIRELDHLIHLQNSGCRNVLRIKRVTFTSKTMCMEFELGTCSLQNFIRNRKNAKGETLKDALDNAIIMTVHILTAIHDMHSANIIHRDMKPGNIILLDSSDTPWIIDLGMSKRVYSDNSLSDSANYELITAPYRAPEMWKKDYRSVLQELNYDDKASVMKEKSRSRKKSTQELLQEIDNTPNSYDAKVDEWSVGCILYELVTGKSVFDGDNEEEIREKIAGHILCKTNYHFDHLCFPRPKVYDIEKQLDEKIASKYNEDPLDFDKETLIMYNGVKIFLRRLLEPEPTDRHSAKDILSIINHLHTKKEEIPKSIDYNDYEKWTDETMLKVIQTMNQTIHTCSYLRIAPKIAHFAIYLFLHVYAISSLKFKSKYCVDTIMYSCFRLIFRYYSISPSAVKEMENATHSSKSTVYKQPKCVIDILRETGGTVWIENPSDYRKQLFPKSNNNKWDNEVEVQIFDAIILLLLADSSPPNVKLVYELLSFRQDEEKEYFHEQ